MAINSDGKPINLKYLEVGLPEYLQESLQKMIASWERIDKGESDLHWDAYWCELNSSINVAEVSDAISHEQANYLRKNYLRMELRND